jgi:uncharacterized protein with PIN domain/sulfur carrier protein ThiS
MSGHVSIRFYEELNDFLSKERQKTPFEIEFRSAGSIKDLIESLGIPHPEVDLIVVNGESVDFDYLVHDGDHISVYPQFESVDISPIIKLRPVPLRVPRFVLDSHLGRLAAYLRMLGFDTLYRNDFDDVTLMNISIDEQRILLTCDKGLLMRKQVTRGYYVRQRQPKRQLLEVLSRFDLFRSQKPFTRCMHCNSEIKPVKKETIASHLMPNTIAHYDEFWQCTDCKKVYWKGSHFQRMQQFVSTLNNSQED